MSKRLLLFLVLLFSFSFSSFSLCLGSTSRVLTLDERVRALEALERVRALHRSPGQRDTIPSRVALERRVRSTLQQSLALERHWNEPVTGAALVRELQRMQSRTRMPERLRELIDALGRDPLLVQECLVRPALVERLVHARFSWDGRIHAGARRRAAELRAGLLAGDPVGIDPITVELVVDGGAPMSPAEPGGPHVRRHVDAAALEEARSSLAHGVSMVRETAEAFFVDVAVLNAPRRLVLSRRAVPKRSWDDWWAEVSPALDPADVVPVATDGTELAPAGLERSACPTAEGWHNGSLGDVPEERTAHTAIWTGTEMLVWGGLGLWEQHPTIGRRYDPALDTWTPMASAGAPAGRRLHLAVWTGAQMIVWGGQNALTLFGDGGRYDPQLDQWVPMSLASAPSTRSEATAVWTGSHMIVWGGSSGGTRLQTGARYDPVTDSWSPTSLVGAPAARRVHSAVWSGSEMIVWGGEVPGSISPSSTSTGGRYDPVMDTWRDTRTQSAPLARGEHLAVWTGTEMIVWGGRSSASWLADGARYDPSRDRWTPVAADGAPSARLRSGAVWSGSEMLVWGGRLLSGQYDGTGARYRPSSDSWMPITTLQAPSGRESHTAVWSGSRMIVFGGLPGPVVTGGAYDPTADAWVPTSTGNGGRARERHTAVWSGAEMLVWGGWNDLPLASGDRYDPALDAWMPMSTAGAPSGRYSHRAVWAGSWMIVWGGQAGNVPVGARYDPATDQWTPTSDQDAPEPRYDHVSVWTGSHMLVWGGRHYWDHTYLRTGGRYDPVTDRWSPMSLAAAPSARWGTSAVWTGIEMIIWGGLGNGYESTGGRYDPRLDRWLPTEGLGSPTGRVNHTAVWTGSEMIVWGGSGNAGEVSDGGRYDPTLDTWSELARSDLSARSEHSAVWTGRDMIVWDGHTSPGGDGTGASYDARTFTWTPVSPIEAPSPRDLHTAVWTGGEMIVWAGDGGVATLRDGGRFTTDSDADGAIDGCDSCVADENPSQVDTDADGFGDACDLCPGVLDAFQGDIDRDGLGDTCDPDRDGDGAPDVTDCAPEHPGVHTRVGEISGLVVDRGGSVLLDWASQGSGVRYDLIGGILSDLRAFGQVTEAACLATRLEVPHWDDTREGPAAGEGWYYLVRGANGCGPGTFGSASDGTEHSNTACP